MPKSLEETTGNSLVTVEWGKPKSVTNGTNLISVSPEPTHKVKSHMTNWAKIFATHGKRLISLIHKEL